MSKSIGGKKLAGAGRINRRERADNDEPKPWWRTSRRRFIVGGAAAATVAAAAGGLWVATRDETRDETRDDTSEVDRDSLDLQQAQGWNVGSEDKLLSLPGAQRFDSQQRDAWGKYLDPSAMLSAFQPKSQEWLPFFVPTLIQSLQYQSLRDQLAPIFTPSMKESYGRGQVFARDFLANSQNAAETAVIVDLPGPDSTAFGAGVAEAAQLIVTFDNFPHPLGVVPSHETLAAMLNYAGEIETKQAAAPARAAPVFLLDSNRLATYADADAQFDNRYLAKLPSAQKLQEMGVRSVVYVVPDRTRAAELDDLNEDFVEYKNKTLNVAILPLSDFVPAAGSGTGEWSEGSARTESERGYYYGGSPASHVLFFRAYPFYIPNQSFARRYPGQLGGRAASFAPALAPPRYAPAPRPTMFSGSRIGGGGAAGVGRSKPSGFGRTTVRVSPSGSVVGTRPGRSGVYTPGRSGSFGRGGGYGG